MTASTSGITDADGLTNVTYNYQWLADDTAIDGATSSTYTLQASDNGKVIKVRVTFTDDAGYGESLTSEGTSAVVLGGLYDSAMQESAKLLNYRCLSLMAPLALTVSLIFLLTGCGDGDGGYLVRRSRR